MAGRRAAEAATLVEETFLLKIAGFLKMLEGMEGSVFSFFSDVMCRKAAKT